MTYFKRKAEARSSELTGFKRNHVKLDTNTLPVENDRKILLHEF